MYTIKQLSKIAGITPRTLHYYDEIDLLNPTRIGDNGYRYYDEVALLRLQQILLYRELDLPLKEVKTILDQPEFELLSALCNHKQQLLNRRNYLDRLIATVNLTISHLQGEIEMSSNQLFEPFNDEQRTEYEKEAMELYDPEIVRASNRKWDEYSQDQKQQIGEEGNAIYQEFTQAMPKGASSQEAQDAVERWRKHMEYFWVPNEDQLLGLSRGYIDDSRFKKKFDEIDPGLAEFIHEAVKEYVKKAGINLNA